MHVHFGPDPNHLRRLDAMELCQRAQELGMRAVVLKSMDYPTAPLANLVNGVLPNITACGSLVLNYEVGGLNPFAVEASGKLGAKVLWMPTLSSANYREKGAKSMGIELKGPGYSILDASGKLLSEAKEVLNVAKQYDMVVASGHISPDEIFEMVDYAQGIGIWKLVITHAFCLSNPNFEKGPSLEELKQLAKRGVFIEHCFLRMMPTLARADPKELANAINEIGSEYAIMSTDLGQCYHPPGPDGMWMFIGIMLRSGVSPWNIEVMVKENPAKLLGL